MPTQLPESCIRFREPQRYDLRWKLLGNSLSGTATFIMIGLFVYSLMSAEPVMLALSTTAVVGIFLLNILFLPVMSGDYWLQRDLAGKSPGLICQVTYAPRAARGTEAALDDGDDFGLFLIEDGWVVFRGDRSFITVKLSDVARVYMRPGGMRTFWLGAWKAVFEFDRPVNNVWAFVVYGRGGLSIFSGREVQRRFVNYMNSLGILSPPYPGPGGQIQAK